VFDGCQGFRLAPEFNILRVINVWRRMDDQPQRAPRTQSGLFFSVYSENSVVFP